jgi:hypothetical protein
MSADRKIGAEQRDGCTAFPHDKSITDTAGEGQMSAPPAR